jgi:hypothetical protein
MYMLDYERWLTDGALMRLRVLIEEAQINPALIEPGQEAAVAAQQQAQGAITEIHDSVTMYGPYDNDFDEAMHWAGFEERLRLAIPIFTALNNFTYPASPYLSTSLKRSIRESEDGTRTLNRAALAIADYVSQLTP